MICLLVFSIFSVIFHEIHSRSKLNAVSKFEGLDNLHMLARNKPLNSNLKYLLKKTKKNRLCRRIFEGAHFNHIGIKFKTCTHRLPHRYTSNTKEIYVYNNALGDTVNENVFTCRCKTTTSSSQKFATKYFVSEEYDISDAPGDQYTAGRFVFIRQNGNFYYEALAEEPATVIEGRNVEKLYLEARGSREVATSVSADPLCKLDIQKKLRLCTLILSSSYFIENKFQFGGSLNHVDGSCRKKRIVFRTDYTRTIVSEGIYEEWMMICQAKHVTEPTTSFFLSRAYASHEVFVYSKETASDRTFLEILACNIRGIIDEIG